MLNRIVNSLSEGIDSEYERGMIRYGVEIIFLKTIFIVSALIMGVVLNKMDYVIVFLMAFIPLRSLVGGYHAETRLKCFIESNIMIFVSLGLSEFFDSNKNYQNIIYIVMLLCLLFILFCTPVESKNKKLSYEQKKIMATKIKIYVGIMIILLFLMIFLDKRQYLNLCLIAIIDSGTLGILGKISCKCED